MRMEVEEIDGGEWENAKNSTEMSEKGGKVVFGSQASFASSPSTVPQCDLTADIRAAFCLYATSLDCMSTEALPKALTNLGFFFDCDECRRIIRALQLAEFGKMTLAEFGFAVIIATLRDHDFPTDDLTKLCGSPASGHRPLDGDLDAWALVRISALLKSNSVNLDASAVTPLTLFALFEAIAEELELKRKIAWLNEIGFVREVSSLLPRFAGKPMTPETTQIPRDGMLTQLSEDLRDIDKFIVTRLDAQTRAQTPSERDGEEESKYLESSTQSKGAEEESKAAEEDSKAAEEESRGSTHRLPLGVNSSLNDSDLSHKKRSPGTSRPPLAPVNVSNGFNDPDLKLSDRRATRLGFSSNAGFNDPDIKRAGSGASGGSWQPSGALPLSTVVKRRGHRFDSWHMIPATEGSFGSSFRGSRKSSDLGVTPSGGATHRRELKWWEQCHADMQWDDDDGYSSLCERLYQDFQVVMFKARGWVASTTWTILLLGFVLFLVLSAGGGVAVWAWAEDVKQSRQVQAFERAQTLSVLLEGKLRSVLSPVTAMGAFVSHVPMLESLSQKASQFPLNPARGAHFHDVLGHIPGDDVMEFVQLAAEVWDSVDPHARSAMHSLILAPRGIVALRYPPGAEDELGMDLLSHESTRSEMRRCLTRANATVVQFPEIHESNLELCVPIFLVDSIPGGINTTQLVGASVVRGHHLWGFASVVFDLQQLVEGEEMGSSEFDFQLRTSENDPSSHTLLAASPNTSQAEITDGADLPFVFLDRTWTLRVGSIQGFRPSRRGYLMAVVFGALGAVLILLTLLVSNRRHKQLLYRIMPRRVVTRLQQGRQVVELFNDVTIFFSDLVGFTDLSMQRSPVQVVAMLNDLYTEFDRLAEHHGVFKVDTIGDAYMVVGGAPDRCSGPVAAARVAAFALDALAVVAASQLQMQMRAGMASGPVVAGVLGTAVPKYSFFGDTVNTASRMESTGKAGRLQVTEATRALLLQSPNCSDLQIDERRYGGGQSGMMVKGKGLMCTYWVQRKTLREASANLELSSEVVLHIQPPHRPADDKVSSSGWTVQTVAVHEDGGSGVSRPPSLFPATGDDESTHSSLRPRPSLMTP